MKVYETSCVKTKGRFWLLPPSLFHYTQQHLWLFFEYSKTITKLYIETFKEFKSVVIVTRPWKLRRVHFRNFWRFWLSEFRRKQRNQWLLELIHFKKKWKLWVAKSKNKIKLVVIEKDESEYWINQNYQHFLEYLQKQGSDTGYESKAFQSKTLLCIWSYQSTPWGQKTNL